MAMVLKMTKTITKSMDSLRQRAEAIGPTDRNLTGKRIILAICIHIPQNKWVTLDETKTLPDAVETIGQFEKRCWIKIINMAEQAIMGDLYGDASPSPSAIG